MAKNIQVGLEINADVSGINNIEQLAQSIAQTSDETSELSQQSQELAQEWQQAKQNTALIEYYKAIKKSLSENRQEIAQTEQQMRQLNAQMQNGATKEQEKEYKKLQNQLAQLNQQKRNLLNTLRDTNTQMNQVGISTKNLAEKQKQFAAQANQAEQELKQLSQEAQRLQQIAQAKAVLGLDVDDHARQEINQLNQAYEELKNNGGLTKAELARATQAYQAKLKELNGTLEQSGHQMTPLASSIGKIGLATAGAVGGLMSLQQGLTDVLNATKEYQAIATRFTYAFGSAEEGAKQLAFVRNEANRLGLEMMGAANGYAQFAAAAKDLNISTEQTQSIFKGVASAAATMGLSAEDANGVFLALSQIAGKGKVSMEELRGQLGERLAPAMSIAAQAMGVTTAELEKMVENGLAAETFLPRFGVALEKAFGADAATNVESLSGQINLLKNSYNEFLIKLGEGGVGQATIAVLKDIGAALEAAQAKFDEFMKSEDGLLLQQSLSQIWGLLKQIGTTIVDVFHIVQDIFSDVSGILTESGREIGIIQSLLTGVNLTVAALHDGFQGVGIVINLLSGATKSLLSSMLNTMSQFTFGSWSAKLKQESQEMREEADKNYQAAHESAMNFESQIGKTIDKMAQNASQVKQVYDNAHYAAKASIDETAKAEAKAQELSQAYKDAQTAATSFGLDMRAAMNEPTPAIAEMLSNLDKLVLGFDDLRQQGVNTGVLIQQAVSKMIDTAANQADIDALKVQIQTLGESGKLSADAVANAFLAVDVKMAEIAEQTSPLAVAFKTLGVISQSTAELQLRQAETALKTIERSGQATEHALIQARNKVQELKDALDPTEQAFERLGIKTKEAMRVSAEQMRKDFELVEHSGEATSSSLKEKFAQVAAEMLASGDVQQQAWVKSKAAAYDYTVTVDSTGKAALQSAAETKAASEQKVAAHKQEAAAAEQAAQAQEKTQTAINTTTSAIKMQRGWLADTTVTAANWFRKSAGGIQTWIRLMVQSISLYKDIDRAIEQVNIGMATGENLAQALAKAESLAASHASVLGKQTLDKLRKAIDDAKNKMRELAEEAQNARLETEKELLRAEGKEDEVARIELQERINALREKQQKARNQGNTRAVDDYEKAIDNINRAAQTQQQREQREREEQLREEAQRQRELEQQQREREEQQRAAFQKTSNVSVKVNTNELADLLAARDEKVANQAVSKLFNDLTEAASRQR